MRPSVRLLALALLVAATPLLAGPSWLSIEHAPNPYDARTRDAFLVVNTYHHQETSASPLRGVAEGIVRGERRSVPLRFTPTSRNGSYALTRQWPTEGKWVLSITLREGHDWDPTALVVLAADGSIANVTIPTRRDGRDLIPRAVTPAELSAALAAAGEQRN